MHDEQARLYFHQLNLVQQVGHCEVSAYFQIQILLVNCSLRFLLLFTLSVLVATPIFYFSLLYLLSFSFYSLLSSCASRWLRFYIVFLFSNTESKRKAVEGEHESKKEKLLHVNIYRKYIYLRAGPSSKSFSTSFGCRTFVPHVVSFRFLFRFFVYLPYDF